MLHGYIRNPFNNIQTNNEPRCLQSQLILRSSQWKWKCIAFACSVLLYYRFWEIL